MIKKVSFVFHIIINTFYMKNKMKIIYENSVEKDTDTIIAWINESINQDEKKKIEWI